jgi:hypothetical protein
MFMPVSVNVPTLPARSVAEPVAVWAAASAVFVIGLVREPSSIPDNESMAENVTVTLVLFQPLELGATSREAETTGAVLSMLIPVSVNVPVLPARSVAEPVAVWAAASAVVVIGSVRVPLSIPDNQSKAENVTVP